MDYFFKHKNEREYSKQNNPPSPSFCQETGALAYQGDGPSATKDEEE